MTNHAIEATQAGDQDQTVGAIVMAFGSDPVARWAFPRPQQFLASFPAFVRAFGGAAFEHGTAHHVEGFSGAALWLPPGALSMPRRGARSRAMRRAPAMRVEATAPLTPMMATPSLFCIGLTFLERDVD